MVTIFGSRINYFLFPLAKRYMIKGVLCTGLIYFRGNPDLSKDCFIYPELTALLIPEVPELLKTSCWYNYPE